ncbi:MAG TPA: DUF5591 domain-containing protein [Phycisphaerae bacterium]|nr:DUF5591 domain-containing protein [Phycisphaerae bacterium]
MDRNEARYRVIAFLLQAEEPLTLDELASGCDIGTAALQAALEGLTRERLVVAGALAPDKPAPQYRWAAYWHSETGPQAAGAKQDLRALVEAKEAQPPAKLTIDGEPVLAFHRFIINRYSPPKDKRFLVFLQCSVRRPFSNSPSHASMRRAIAVATGFDPRDERQQCPVHVVVLASKIGPVPYELEDVYPANVGGGGVKHFDREYYARVRPVLAERMAEYMSTHGGHYEKMASFTEGRYGEVMEEAAKIAGVELPIFPDKSGPRVIQMGGSKPRAYWQRYWIQLYLEIVGWLDPPQQAEAAERLAALEVEFR